MLAHHIAQAWMVVFSMLSIFCVARTDRWHKWGFVAGLLSEPAYVFMAFETPDVQWGILVLVFWWTYYWGIGALRRFGKNEA